MEETEFEIVGNNRYFKYRYAQEVPINISTLSETWDMKNLVLRYQITADFLKRASNLKTFYEEHKMSYFDIPKLYNEPNFFNKAHVLLLPGQLSCFAGMQKYFTPSPVYDTTKTIIVSAAPRRLVSIYFSLNMNTEVVILTVSTVVLLSLLLVIHSIVMNKYKSLPSKKIVKQMVRETMKNVWDHASLLCAEHCAPPLLKPGIDLILEAGMENAISTVSSHITYRLLASSWLFGVTFILFSLGCYLRTEFTTETYSYIDTLSDLIKSGIRPTMIEGTGTLEYLKVLAVKDPVVQEWLDALDVENIYTPLVEYLTIDGYLPILSGERALIIPDLYLTWFMGTFLSGDSESMENIMNNGGLYISQHEIGFEYLHFLYNTSWLRGSPQLHEICQLCMTPLWETQAVKYLNLELYHSIESVKWKKPLKSSANLDLSSVTVPFYLFFMLMSGTVAMVITEIFLKQLAF